MTKPTTLASQNDVTHPSVLAPTCLLVLLFFVYAGDAAPMINEAHYLVKAKNFWQPDWCQYDLFASSGKAHATYYVALGWLTKFVSLETTAWVGRLIGWCLVATGLARLCRALFRNRWASIVVAIVWMAGVEYGNLAGEWVIGGTEAKVPAYGFVLMGLAELVHRRWNRVWVYLGAASAFHVLTGGWSVVAAMLAWCLTERNRDDRYPFWTTGLFVGGGLSLFGLVPAIALSMGVTDAESIAAAKIYSYFRIRHHLLPADFDGWWYVRHGITLVISSAGIAIFLRQSRKLQRLYAFALGAVLIAGGGLVVGSLPAAMPDLAAKLLRFYWFRLSDAIVPLILGVLVMQAIIDQRTWLRSTGFGLFLIAMGLVGFSVHDRTRIPVPPSTDNRTLGWDADASAETQASTFTDWLKVCYWAKQSTPASEVFLTPRHQQTFKWYAERAEVVNWKDVPQDAKSLFEWDRRFADVFPTRLGTIRVTIGYRALRDYRDRYGVRFMIVDRRVVGEDLPLVRVYPLQSEDNPTYAVYELPR
ncbi:DUF6798 domain-containing protein [Rubripirellula tenax]|nr:DUF6798 domain-containing protein [Rubripirellula tenax]